MVTGHAGCQSSDNLQWFFLMVTIQKLIWNSDVYRLCVYKHAYFIDLMLYEGSRHLAGVSSEDNYFAKTGQKGGRHQVHHCSSCRLTALRPTVLIVCTPEQNLSYIVMRKSFSLWTFHHLHQSVTTQNDCIYTYSEAVVSVSCVCYCRAFITLYTCFVTFAMSLDFLACLIYSVFTSTEPCLFLTPNLPADFVPLLLTFVPVKTLKRTCIQVCPFLAKQRHSH